MKKYTIGLITGALLAISAMNMMNFIFRKVVSYMYTLPAMK